MSINKRNHLTCSAFMFCLLMVLTFSCAENEADESPTNLDLTIHESTTANSSLDLDGTKIPIQTIGKKIPNETANRWLQNHSKKNPDGINYHLFGKDAFLRLLNQPNAAGIRLCRALDDSGNPIIVMVAVDENNSLLDSPTQEGYEDVSYNCPPQCPN